MNPIDRKFLIVGIGASAGGIEALKLIWIVQEALTNVARHGSGATAVNITIIKSDNEVLAMVEDNGPGFDVTSLTKLPPEKRRLGIMGMQERAELMNGTLTIESQIGKETVITLQLPLSL